MKRAALMFIFVLVATASIASAERHIVTLGTSNVTTITPRDKSHGDFYLVRLEIPRILEGKEFLGAFLEITADVNAKTIDGYTNETPMLEIFALTEDYANELDPSKFRMHSPMHRNIRLGNNRNIKIDIKEIIKEFMRDPDSNHGLVIGSLTNARDGLFDVISSNGQLGAITYYYMEK
jgi:hypothetical protein